MNRAELIAEIWAALEAKDFDAVRLLAAEAYDAGHRDVCDRAHVAAARVRRGGPVSRSQEVSVLRTPVLLEGYYTVTAEGGLWSFKVERQAENAPFAGGQRIVSYTRKSRWTSFTAFGFARDEGGIKTWAKHKGDKHLAAAVVVLLADPKAAGFAYAKQTVRCCVCARELSEPESVAAGVGPVCREKWYA